MILDVGCGVNPRGDVNLDLSTGGDYGTLQTLANTYGSVLNLPYANDSFEIVTFNGLLHHLEDPKRAWREMVRVAKTAIIGIEPGFPVWPGWITGIPLDATEKRHRFSRRDLVDIVKEGVSSYTIERTLSVKRFLFATRLRIIAYKKEIA